MLFRSEDPLLPSLEVTTIYPRRRGGSAVHPFQETLLSRSQTFRSRAVTRRGAKVVVTLYYHCPPQRSRSKEPSNCKPRHRNAPMGPTCSWTVAELCTPRTNRPLPNNLACTTDPPNIRSPVVTGNIQHPTRLQWYLKGAHLYLARRRAVHSTVWSAGRLDNSL